MDGGGGRGNERNDGGPGNDRLEPRFGNPGEVVNCGPGRDTVVLGAGDTAVNFYVVRIDFHGGNDDVRVYRNPTSLTEPATPTVNVALLALVKAGA